ncbi:MAG: hypothetical protein HY936_09585 [Nitrosomonadales bacterium]|nr:hypothetical protein [Nitrosomonadales bacterium]
MDATKNYLDKIFEEFKEKITHVNFTKSFTNLTVSQSDQGMQCKAKSGEKAEFTCSK